MFLPLYFESGVKSVLEDFEELFKIQVLVVQHRSNVYPLVNILAYYFSHPDSLNRP